MSRDTSNDPDSEGSTGVEERLDRLESLVETQQETIQQQRERITELDGETDSDDTPLLTNRRNTLKAGGLLALLFGGVGTASADPQGQVGTSSDPLETLYTAELNGGITGDTALTDLTGTGLQIASESLTFDQSITPTWTGTHTYDTDGSANLNVDETGVYYSTANSETLNIQNSGGGSVTLQEDGTSVVTESRSLTGGHAVQSLGDLSSDRTVAVDSTALSGSYLTASGSSSVLDVTLGNGLEGDGNSPAGVRVDGSTVAGNVLSAGANAYEIDVSIGNGLTNNSGSLGIDEIGSDEIATNAVTNSELAGDSVEGAQIAESVVTDTELDSDSVESAQIATDAVGTSELANDSVTVSSGNGLTGGGEVSLGGSTTLDIDITQVGSGTGVLGSISSSGVEYRSLSGTDGLTVTENDGTISIGTTATTTETISSFTSDDLASSSIVTISDGNLEGGSEQSSTATRLPDDDTFINQNGTLYGVEIEPQADLTSISVTISSNTSGENSVSLVDTDLDTIAQEPSPGAGNSVTLTANLSAGTKYGILVDADDGGQRDDASFPFTSQYVDITNGAYDLSGTYSTDEDANCIRKVTGFPPPEGEATIQWPDATPVSRWKTATFQAVQTGGSVEVYVETDDGSGWSTWGSDPIGPGTDLSSIPGDSRVRFRVEFTGSQESGTPKLTLASRQYRP